MFLAAFSQRNKIPKWCPDFSVRQKNISSRKCKMDKNVFFKNVQNTNFIMSFKNYFCIKPDTPFHKYSYKFSSTLCRNVPTND